MPRSTLTIEQVLATLAETPSRIAALTTGLTPAQLQTAPDHDKWSANDLLAHLRSCADIWGDCIVTIITQDNPTIRAVNPTTWIKETDYTEQKFQRSLDAYAAQRSELMTLLEPLDLAAWSRSATVTGAGKPLERTLLFYAQWLASHERTHLKQFKRIAEAMRTRSS